MKRGMVLLAGAAAVWLGTAVALAKPGTLTIDATTYELIALEHARDADNPRLHQLADHGSATIRARLGIVLGRIADPRTLGLVERLLQDLDSEVRRSAAFALGQMDTENSRKLLDVLFEREDDPKVLGEALKSLGFVGGENAPDYFNRFLVRSETGAMAAHGLGKWLIFKAPSDMRVQLATIQQLASMAAGLHEPTAKKAAFALSRIRVYPENFDYQVVLRSFHAATVFESRVLLTRALARLDHPAVTAALVEATEHILYRQRVEAVRALGAHTATMASREALIAAMNDRNLQVAVQAAQVLRGEQGRAGRLAEVASGIMDRESSWLKGEFLLTLATHDKVAAKPFIDQILADEDQGLRRYGILALAVNGTITESDQLSGLLRAEDALSQRTAAEASLILPTAAVSQELVAALAEAANSKDLSVVYYASQFAIQNSNREIFQALLAIYPELTSPADVEAKVAVLEAIGTLGDDTHLPLLEQALTDGTKQVVEAAAAAYQKLTGTDVSNRIPVNAPTEAPLPSRAELNAAINATVTISTTRGDLVLKMLDQAPLTAATVVGLAKTDFYHGKVFHRVVPHFVAQGGDPRGDGFGGLEYSIRDEVGTLDHTEGVVGIATAGKDTGSCQFFINHGDNLHLDGRYTTFAKLMFGYRVLTTLEQGDVIVSTRVDL